MDNENVYNSVKKGWISKWRKNGWITTRGRPVVNKEHYEKLMEMTEEFEDTSYCKISWTKVERKFNKEADSLAKKACNL